MAKFIVGLHLEYENVWAPILISSEVPSLYEVYSRVSIFPSTLVMFPLGTSLLWSLLVVIVESQLEVVVVKYSW